ncbi:hypothetical protein MHC_01475 [Mycoplasma haemocanis str. Illinois]|uniref:Uncharacterized protein n=1 Tax=Mycoplasma haemocanis (strain Illinois) TaxID=1111676 RepID=H6N689_MYCHN|nr:hypothetical protein [Mycoplasma haemocanis]AEW45161.2 hypothetical protein MHC_01475 [Mycoplasma haemocanis str. Illinois]
MKRIAFISLGIAGTTGASVGSYFLVERSKSFAIKNKYPQALLNEADDSTLWNQKYKIIKDSTPHNDTLKKAVAKSKEVGKDDEAKTLLKRGCFEIYESSYEDINSFSDFKNYCAKTNKDESKNGTWNTDAVDKGSDNKWDKAIDALKSRKNSDKLDPVLERLKLEAMDNNPNVQNIRTKLKQWCEDTNNEVFMGKDSLKFENQESFCKVIN